MKGEVKIIHINSCCNTLGLFSDPWKKEKIAFADSVFGNQILDHRSKNLEDLFVVCYLFCLRYFSSDSWYGMLAFLALFITNSKLENVCQGLSNSLLLEYLQSDCFGCDRKTSVFVFK